MRKFILFSLLVLFASAIVAQEEEAPTKVKISTDKVKIDGKNYYIHIVRSGETLFSISKAYGVSQIEIAMENPDIYLGLQVDQALKIPVKKQDVEEENEDENYIYHVVRRRETLTSLTRKYNVHKQEILAANPEIDENIRINQVILIPKKRISTIGQTEDVNDKFIYHEVQPREGFFALRRKYGVSEETIRKFNPEQTQDGLKLGTIIKIPKDPTDTTHTTSTSEEVFAEVQEIADYPKPSAETSTVICDTFEYNRWRDVFNVALLLPFSQKEEVTLTDTLETNENGLQQNEQEKQKRERILPQTANFLDFYQGALLAVDSLRSMGISINLNVLNTERSAEKAIELTQKSAMQNAHLIIGPAYTECLQPISQFAIENRIPMVSPLSRSNYLLEMNPYLFQANPSLMTQLEEFIEIVDFCNGQNIVLVHESDSSNIGLINRVKDLILKRIDRCPSARLIHFKEVSYKAGSPAIEVQERISHSLTHEKENLIFVPSNNEAFVSDLLGNIQALSTVYKYPISIYGFPSWQKFRNVQVDYLYNLQLHLFTPFFVNYGNPLVKSFITKYRHEFRSEPSQYSYQGYDVMLYFLTAMQKYGIDFKFCISNHKADLLQSKFSFEQNNALSGFENRAVHAIKYTKNYEIVRIDDSTKLQVLNPIIYIEEPEVNKKEAVEVIEQQQEQQQE